MFKIKSFLSIVIITSLLAPDLTRAMENEDQKPQKLYRSASLPDLSKLSTPNKSLPLKGTNKPKRSSLNLLAPLKSSLSSKEEIIFQPLNKGCESKKSSSDSNTTSPRKEETVEELSSSKNSSQLSTSSSPEKSNSLESSPKKKIIVSYMEKKDTKQDPIPQLFQNPQELPILFEIKEIESPENDSATEKKLTEGTKSESENKTPLITQQPIQQTKNFGAKLKKELRYDEKTPLLIDQKKTPQKKTILPFDKKERPNKELATFPIKGSINQSESEHRDFNIEEDTEIISQEDHKDKKDGNSGSTDSFLLLEDNLELKDKKGCCCNRPCLPHPELWRKVSDLRNVIESSEQDEPQINTSDLPNVTETTSKKKSSQLSLIVLRDEEQKLTPTLFLEKLQTLDFNQLSKHTKAQLNYIVREMEGAWPKWEWVKLKQWGKIKECAKNELPGFVVGAGVGVWLSKATVPVYISSINYLENKYIFFDLKPWVNIMNGIESAIPFYVISSVIEDAVPRNVILWNKGLALLKEENISKKRIALTALASFFPSLFEPFYLILFELELIANAILNQDDTTPYKQAMLTYVWPLFMDSWASNFQTTWNLWDDYEEWKQSTTCCVFSKTLHTRIPSQDELDRRDFRKKLNKVEKFLYRTASNKEIETMYKAVQGSKKEAEKQFENLDEQSLSNAQALLTLNYFLSTGDDLEQTQRYIKSWYEVTADIVTDTFLVTGSPARLLTLQLIISSITDLIPMPSWLRHGLNWGLAGIGWIPQTLLEWKGMRTFFGQFLAQQEPDSEAIYKNAKVVGGFRVGAKAYALGQAFVFTIPLVITVLQATNKWKMDPHWMIGAATFLFAEFATQASQQWERSAQKWVSFFANAHNGAIRDKCLKKPLRIEYQRSHLIDLNQKFKDRLPYLSPELFQMLKGNMNLKDNLTEEEN